MNMYLVIMKGTYGAINADDSSCHDYYILKFSSSPYTFKGDLRIDGRFISYGEMVGEGTNLFLINMNAHYYFLQKLNP